MKGKLILTDISTPVEGMKVVCGNKIDTIIQYPFKSEYNNDDNQGYNVLLQNEGTQVLSNLKQIAIEYASGNNKETFGFQVVDTREKHTLSLHPDDYERAVGLIGQEVEFYGQEGKEIDIPSMDGVGIPPIRKREVFAKLFPEKMPTPVYEEEIEHLLSTKENQKELLKSIMQLDEETGLYEFASTGISPKEWTPEDVARAEGFVQGYREGKKSQSKETWAAIFADCAKKEKTVTVGVLTQYLIKYYHAPKKK